MWQKERLLNIALDHLPSSIHSGTSLSTPRRAGGGPRPSPSSTPSPAISPPADAFVYPIARSSRVLVEPWIEGAALGPREAEVRAEEAGALMGCLHAIPLPGAPARIDTRAWCGLASEALGRLGSARTLAAPEVANLRALLSQDDPGSGCAALVHRDYCPENLLADRLGRLRVIDNEWFKIDAPG
jgi:hypothetical protein